MELFFQKFLASLARAIIKKYRPDIIGVTGSVGKTSTKDAIVLVLSGNFSVRGNEMNYNNEIGVPLTVIGAHAQGKSLFGWLTVFFKAVTLLIKKDSQYPSILVLEMGADQPGDIEKLVTIAPPKIGVITAISPAHTEKLGSLRDVLEEKSKIFCRHSTADHWMVLNADDPSLLPLSENACACVMTFGQQAHATVRSSHVVERFVFKSDRPYAGGLFCTLTVDGHSVDAEFPHVLGTHILSSALAAVAVGTIYHIPLNKIVHELSEYTSPKGRMRPLYGIKKTLLIDDTYNASPKAARAALNVLIHFEINRGARRIAVLGDMRELGEISKKEHKSLGEYAVSCGVDLLLCVGESAEYIASGARDAHLDESRIFVFNDSASAGHALQDMMEEGDIVLIKGSQAVRMERIVKEVMAEPLRAEELLVRQTARWIQSN